MVERQRGKIINICSVQSEWPTTIAPYTATKGGLKLLTRGMCADLGPLGIQVNAIAPGYFATELTAALVAGEEFSAWVAKRTPPGAGAVSTSSPEQRSSSPRPLRLRKRPDPLRRRRQ